MTETLNRANIHKNRHDEWYTPAALLSDLIEVMRDKFRHIPKKPILGAIPQNINDVEEQNFQYFDPCSSKSCYDLLPDNAKPFAFLDKEGWLWVEGLPIRKIEGGDTPSGQVWLSICQELNLCNIWCNPPFSKGRLFLNAGEQMVKLWTAESWKKIERGESKPMIALPQILFLLPANTEAIWFQEWVDRNSTYVDALVFLKRRVQFYDGTASAKKNNNSGGNVLVPLHLQDRNRHLIDWAKARNHLAVRLINDIIGSRA